MYIYRIVYQLFTGWQQTEQSFCCTKMVNRWFISHQLREKN
jgi:hypothetical protein